MTSLEKDITSKRNSLILIFWQALHFPCDMTEKPENCLLLPPAHISFSARSHGPPWVSGITSLAAAKRLKLQAAQRLHQERCKEEVTATQQEVLFLQWPLSLVQTLWQNCTICILPCYFLTFSIVQTLELCDTAHLKQKANSKPSMKVNKSGEEACDYLLLLAFYWQDRCSSPTLTGFYNHMMSSSTFKFDS